MTSFSATHHEPEHDDDYDTLVREPFTEADGDNGSMPGAGAEITEPRAVAIGAIGRGMGREGSVKRAPRPAKSRGLDGTVVRKVLDKHAQITAASVEQRALLGSLLGTDDDPHALTVAVLTGRPGVAAVTDLMALHGMKESLAVVTVLTWERDRQLAVWNLLVALGVRTGRYPAVDAKAALEMAEAVTGMSGADLVGLAAVADLARA